VIENCTRSPLTAWINVVGPEPYGALSNCGLVRLFAETLTLMFVSHWMVHVTVAELFPVAHSMLVVVMFAVLTNTYHELSKLASVHVNTIVPPLPAGSVQMVNALTGIFIHAGTISVITTLSADLPPLFP